MQVNQSKQSDEIEKIWSSEAIGLQNPRALLHLVWSNDVTHLGMQGIKEQHDCQPSDLLLLNGILNTTNAKHRTAMGNEGRAKKWARKYNNKMWTMDRGERDPYHTFVEYIRHHPKGDDPSNFYVSLIPVQ